MPIKDQIKNFAKKLVEDRPDAAALRALVQARKPTAIRFRDDGIVPSNPAVSRCCSIAAWWISRSRRFLLRSSSTRCSIRHGWGRSWRDTVYDSVHYHSQIHEVMGVARGTARIECGGNQGAHLAA